MNSRGVRSLAMVVAVVVVALTAVQCKSKYCPPDTSQIGYPPPDGKSVVCMKRIEIDGLGKEVPHGLFKKWFADGSPAVDTMYSEGKKQGHYIEWWEKGGKTKIEADYVKDVPDGTYTEFRRSRHTL